jgi:hypothetical protein
MMRTILGSGAEGAAEAAGRHAAPTAMRTEILMVERARAGAENGLTDVM